ncbi:hypothetical protein MKZ38_009158 [Zalerion maritima]|uniref:C2H2-type domain-containing protein n=1 Tax=Zalerion maritima TaxID=339359 RepID=A0AAD5WN89_9PEZI|nr:hypothetical protein MKZ38_009158 [Zalerion maritima]
MFLTAPTSHIQHPSYPDSSSPQTQPQQQATNTHHLPVSPPATLSPPDHTHPYRRQPPSPAPYQMDNRGNEYSQPGLPSPYPSAQGNTHSEQSSLADPASAAQYPTQQEVRPSNYSTSATPTSEYGNYPSSARSSHFPEHIQQRQAGYAPPGTHAGGTGGRNTSPPQTGRQVGPERCAANATVTEHSIPAPSPTYPPGAAQYPSPYGPPQEMSHPYSHPGSMYAQARPDWSNYSQPSPLTPGHPVYHPPASAPARPHGQVYSFVPIPGATQHKRPRRRYEEIERMYKCGWNGCEKAYGTLNHLNAHVTMQSHGTKRTPEEFKEIRKEWKARKKEEEAQRKADEDRQRQAQQAAQQAAQNGSSENQTAADPSQTPTTYASRAAVQLPPIGYSPQPYPAPPQAGVPQQPLPESYNSSQLYPGSYAGGPASPYGQQQPQSIYGQQASAPQPSST